MALAVAVTGLGAAAAAARIVPFEKVSGVRLGMTLKQAKAALGPSCPTLTRRTRRDRARYECYFSVFAGRGTWQELTYTRLGKCGADVSLHARHVVEVESSCHDSLRGGVGIGSTFHEMYARFAPGTVRCLRRGENGADTCFAQKRRRGDILLTTFADDVDDLDLEVHYVGVRKCTFVSPSPPAGKPAFMPCTKTFLTAQARVRGEFTP